ncbi:MAG: type II toxin-antitoxin system RelE/ParE family toxin [bacterium]
MKRKPLIWIGSSKEDLREFPDEVKSGVGYALHLAQKGERGVHSKVLKGFGGAGVLEIIESDESGTFRVVYTVKMPKCVFVLHAFQKKSKQGIETPKREMDLVEKRLKEAQEVYKDLNNEEKI